VPRHDETHPDDYVEKISSGDYAVHTEIDINAPADIVWATLTDFDHMDWSSSFKGIEGEIEEGAAVVAHFQAAGRDQRFEHILIEVEPGVQWAWSDPFMMGMIDHHLYRVEPIDDQRSRFIQEDRPHGGAAIAAGRITAEGFKRMYEQFNEELKSEAERRYRFDEAQY